MAASEAIQLRLAGADPIKELDRLATMQPWGGLAAREASWNLERNWPDNRASRLVALDWALTRYPVDPQAWLLRARLLHQTQGVDMETRLSLNAAISAQPHSRELNWRALGMAEALGDTDLVAHLLRQSTFGRSLNVERSLFVAARWFPDPGERLDRALPEGERYLIASMRYARDQGLPELAQAAWLRLDQPREPQEQVLADYLHVQREHGQHDRVLSVLQTLDPAYRPGSLPGGDFSVPMATLRHLGWSLRVPAGARLVRDERDLPPGLPTPHSDAPLPQASLRLEFSGQENLRLNGPRVRFRPTEPGQYRLTGWWKAERLTTRALPRLELSMEGTRTRHHVEVPGPSFEWQQFTIDFTVDESLPVFQFRVARPSTQAFDRYLGGRLSLAGLHTELILDSLPDDP